MLCMCYKYCNKQNKTRTAYAFSFLVVYIGLKSQGLAALKI